MRYSFVLSLLFAEVVCAQVGSDSLSVHPRVLPHQFYERDFSNLVPFHPRVESDGVVIGHTKYFIRIVEPDSSFTRWIPIIVPDERGLEKMPMYPYEPPPGKPKASKIVPLMQ